MLLKLSDLFHVSRKTARAGFCSTKQLISAGIARKTKEKKDSRERRYSIEAVVDNYSIDEVSGEVLIPFPISIYERENERERVCVCVCVDVCFLV